jgi:hypothetical protein
MNRIGDSALAREGNRPSAPSLDVRGVSFKVTPGYFVLRRSSLTTRHCPSRTIGEAGIDRRPHGENVSRGSALSSFESMVLSLMMTQAANGIPSGNMALVLRENRGLLAEETLHFAEDDASRVSQAFINVADFAEEDVVTLRGATATSVRAALASLSQRLRQAPVRRLLVYVSSHAADGILHVDACRSGGITRTKGLKANSNPQRQMEAASSEGRVFISASGADEYAKLALPVQGREAEGGTTSAVRPRIR